MYVLFCYDLLMLLNTRIEFRCSKKQKNLYKKEANALGFQQVGEWIRHLLDQECAYCQTNDEIRS